jgi:hypothetical protein
VFKSLISLILSDLLFPLSLIGVAVLCESVFSKHWFGYTVIGWFFLIFIFTRISAPFDKLK